MCKGNTLYSCVQYMLELAKCLICWEKSCNMIVENLFLMENKFVFAENFGGVSVPKVEQIF